MSWQWPTAGSPAAPAAGWPTTPMLPQINTPMVATSAPTPAGTNYTAEQWAAMQQNWQQWSQWQQQYTQWQQQYGAEYQKSLNALAQQQQIAAPPPLPPTADVQAANPAPPAEPKPPLPPGEPPKNAPYSSYNLNSAPVTYAKPHSIGGDLNDNKSYLNAAPAPASQNKPSPPNNYEEDQNYGSTDYNRASKSPRNFSNSNSSRGSNKNSYPPPQQQWGNKFGNRTSGNFGNANRQPSNQNANHSGGAPPSLLSLEVAKPPMVPPTNPPTGIKRSFDQQGGSPYQENFKRNRWENDSGSNIPVNDTTENCWRSGKTTPQSRWTPAAQKNQNVPPAVANAAAATTKQAGAEELSDAEKNFDVQFAEWEAQFNKWKEQNAAHPDKQQYKEYEAKWEAWKTQLLDRREQMRRKRLGLASESPHLSDKGSNSSKSVPIVPQIPKPFSSNVPTITPAAVQKSPIKTVSSPHSGTKHASPLDLQSKQTSNSENSWPLANKAPHESEKPVFNQPPPTMNNAPLEFKKLQTDAPANETPIISVEDMQPKEQRKNVRPRIPTLNFLQELTPEPEVKDLFAKSSKGGIPGLDLVPPNPKERDNDNVIDLEESLNKSTGENRSVTENTPDFAAISRGINNILGDQKLLNMLSMVSKNQNPLTASQDSVPPATGISNATQLEPINNSLSNEQNQDYHDSYQEDPYKNEYSDNRFEGNQGHNNRYDQSYRDDGRDFGAGNFNDNFRNQTMGGNQNVPFNKDNSFQRTNSQEDFQGRWPNQSNAQGGRNNNFSDRRNPPGGFNRGDEFNNENPQGNFPERGSYNQNPQHADFNQKRHFNQNNFQNETNQGLQQGGFNQQNRFSANQNPAFNQNRLQPTPGGGNFNPNMQQHRNFNQLDNQGFNPSNSSSFQEPNNFNPNTPRGGMNPNMSPFGFNQKTNPKFNTNLLQGSSNNRNIPSNDFNQPINQRPFNDPNIRDEGGFNQSNMQGGFQKDTLNRPRSVNNDNDRQPTPGNMQNMPLGNNSNRFAADNFRGPPPRGGSLQQNEPGPNIMGGRVPNANIRGNYDEYGNQNKNYPSNFDYKSNSEWNRDSPNNYAKNNVTKEMKENFPKVGEEFPPKSNLWPGDFLKPEIVIEYNHKPKNSPVEPELFISPIQSFDYRHMPINRTIGFKPQWLLDTLPRSSDKYDRRPYQPYERRERIRERFNPNFSADNSYGGDQKYRDTTPTKSPFHLRQDNSKRPPPYKGGYADGRRSVGSGDFHDEIDSINSPDRFSDSGSKYKSHSGGNECIVIEDNLSDMDVEEVNMDKFSNNSNSGSGSMHRGPTMQTFPIRPAAKNEPILIEDLLVAPGRHSRPPRIALIIRGPPGSGKTFLAKLIKDKEVEQGGSAPRILSLDDYFTIEQEKEVKEDGRTMKVKEMVYEYEQCMESCYMTSLLKSFKKTITDGYFSFIIVDSVFDKVAQFAEIWSFAKQKGFQVYVCQMELDAQVCVKRNIHNRTEAEIEKLVKGWESTPNHIFTIDPTHLIQDGSIDDVEMEEATQTNAQDEEGEEDQAFTSKWDNFEYSGENLAKLDGTSKPLRPSRSMEDYLQLDDEWKSEPSKPGQKRVRWADLEERREQEKMRAIGFVVGQTNWERMMDPSMGSRALTQTKYIERVRRY